MSATVTAVIWVAILVGAAISDLRAFRIPNIFAVGLLLLFPVHYAFAGFSPALWPHLFHFVLALAVGMALFARGWVGGGDAKLYAAAALWFDWSGAAALVFLTTISGLFLAIIFVLARKAGFRKNVAKQDARIPYGVAIAGGAILAAQWVGWANIFPAFS
ncbi:MAG TPA: prepilin peptidase [Sphingorhabdus sp.]|jgi:prepilin peptidase CpaA|nr:prepilin peptidase [Sphingorhabdus sp.]